jgi:hypothetical protein
VSLSFCHFCFCFFAFLLFCFDLFFSFFLFVIICFLCWIWFKVIALDWNISDDIERAWKIVGAAAGAGTGTAGGADVDCGGSGERGDGGLLVLCSDLVFGNAFEGLIDLLVGLQTEQQDKEQGQTPSVPRVQILFSFEERDDRLGDGCFVLFFCSTFELTSLVYLCDPDFPFVQVSRCVFLFCRLILLALHSLPSFSCFTFAHVATTHNFFIQVSQPRILSCPSRTLLFGAHWL